MARNRNSIAQFVSFDMQAMATHIQDMTDAQLGAWCRKMVIDCCSGCIATDADPFVRHYYNRSHTKMVEKQNHDSNTYQNRLRRNQEIYDQETAQSNHHNPATISTNDQAGNPPTRESETRGPQTDNNLAESATRTSEAIKALADGDIREDSRGRYAPPSCSPEDGIPAETVPTAGGSCGEISDAATTPTPISIDEARESQARQSRGIGEDSLRGKSAPAGRHCPANSPVPSRAAKKPYGTSALVTLTDSQAKELRDYYGEDFDRAVGILENYILSLPSKAEGDEKGDSKYWRESYAKRNHYFTMRRDNWVDNALKKAKTADKRLENASNPNYKSFKQMDADDRTEFFSKSIFDKEVV